jgi:hypothetical protein
MVRIGRRVYEVKKSNVPNVLNLSHLSRKSERSYWDEIHGNEERS